MSAMGRLARGIMVVSHHIGRPRHSTISQKEKMTRDLLRVSDGFSVGGSLRPVVLGLIAAVSSATSKWGARVAADMAAAATWRRACAPVLVKKGVPDEVKRGIMRDGDVVQGGPSS